MLTRSATLVSMGTRDHWDGVYERKSPGDTSWYRPHLERSLELVESTGLSLDAAIIDVGGGASTFVDDLLARGFTNVTILDIAATALDAAKARLGENAARVRWIVADVTTVDLPVAAFDFWHDRAVFHFLTDADDRARYVARLRSVVTGGGTVIIGTFAPDGPERCSGLAVCRYDAAGIGAELGEGFTLAETVADAHRTPAGALQSFIFSRFVRDR